MVCEISVIVPIYKVEAFMHKCVDSILRQTFTDFELILVDDGSPDNCGALCDAYAKKDGRVRVIHKKNGGLSDARNAGIEIAEGKYIAFVDSDDWVSDTFLSVMHDEAVRTDADIVAVNFHKVYDDRSDPPQEIKPSVCTGTQSMERLYANESIYINIACNKLYKRALFDNICYPVGRLHEDGLTTYKLLYQAKKVSLLQEDLYCYYQRPTSIMNTAFTEARTDEYRVYAEREKFFAENGLVNLLCENYRVCTACMKSLLYKMYRTQNFDRATAKKWTKIFREDVKRHERFIRENFSQSFLISLKLFFAFPRLSCLLHDIKGIR